MDPLKVSEVQSPPCGWSGRCLSLETLAWRWSLLPQALARAERCEQTLLPWGTNSLCCVSKQVEWRHLVNRVTPNLLQTKRIFKELSSANKILLEWQQHFEHCWGAFVEKLSLVNHDEHQSLHCICLGRRHVHAGPASMLPNSWLLL